LKLVWLNLDFPEKIDYISDEINACVLPGQHAVNKQRSLHKDRQNRDVSVLPDTR
jgi:hypothetical protein